MTGQEKFKQIVDNYTSKDAKIIRDTIDMLARKGIGNGCYQDYTVLMSVLAVLEAFEIAVKERGDK